MKHMLEKTFPEKLTGQLKNGWTAIAAATMMLPGTMAVPAAENHTERSASGRIDSSLY